MTEAETCHRWNGRCGIARHERASRDLSARGFARSLTGKWHTTVAAVEVVMKSQSSRYLRGTRAGEEPVTIHAAVLRGQDEYTALCDNRAVVPLPGIFDPGDSAACPLCRSLAA